MRLTNLTKEMKLMLRELIDWNYHDKNDKKPSRYKNQEKKKWKQQKEVESPNLLESMQQLGM